METGWTPAGGGEIDDPRSKWIDPEAPTETKTEEIFVKEIVDKDRRKHRLMQTKVTPSGKEFPFPRSEAIALQLQRDLAK